MAETFELISRISFIIAIVFALIALITWFLFKILSVIGDLSGRTAKKSIENMRKYNESSGDNSYKLSQANNNRVKLTDTMEQDNKKKHNSKEVHYETGLLDENKAKQYDTEETGILLDNEETAMLVDDEGTGVLMDDEVTSLLMSDESTSRLTEGNEKYRLEEKNIEPVMIEEVIYIHTDEVMR